MTRTRRRPEREGTPPRASSGRRSAHGAEAGAPTARWPMLQAAVYAAETAVLLAILWTAASGSPEFVLGPLARVVVAASLPLPCHLLWLAHFLWQGRERRAVRWRPSSALPQPARS